MHIPDFRHCMVSRKPWKPVENVGFPSMCQIKNGAAHHWKPPNHWTPLENVVFSSIRRARAKKEIVPLHGSPQTFKNLVKIKHFCTCTKRLAKKNGCKSCKTKWKPTSCQKRIRRRTIIHTSANLIARHVIYYYFITFFNLLLSENRLWFGTSPVMQRGSPVMPGDFPVTRHTSRLHFSGISTFQVKLKRNKRYTNVPALDV